MLKTLRTVIQSPPRHADCLWTDGLGKTARPSTAALAEIDVFSRNIITIEDPIEYRLDNISQTAVNNAAELTFAKSFGRYSRQDPDVILVGEIRDRETAEIAMQAALTGHFVCTTLHANDTATTITRLLDIGIEATLIQSAATAVLAQRLVRRLCQHCKQPYTPPLQLLQRLGIPADERPSTFYREEGLRGVPWGRATRGRTGISPSRWWSTTPFVRAVGGAAIDPGDRRGPPAGRPACDHAPAIGPL